MGKKRKLDAAASTDPNISSATLVNPAASVDPALASLFANSAGPVNIRVAPPELSKRKRDQKDDETENGDGRIAEATNSLSLAEGDDTSDDGSSSSLSDQEDVQVTAKRRRKVRAADDIEGDYMKKLANEEAASHQRDNKGTKDQDVDQDTSASGEQVDITETRGQSMSPIPQHETTTSTPIDTSASTVFLSNISTLAITHKPSRKVLLRHLSSPFSQSQSQPESDSESPSPSEHKLVSLRFRSTPLDPSAGPKRAAFTTKKLMDATAHSTNAYAVYSSPEAASLAVTALNATIVLDRHMHADLVAHPSAIETRKCVFVGNLGFVDQETPDPNPNQNSNNDPPGPRRPKGKLPADAEEGLWRTFGKIGAVQSVRVVRDPITRVGKGFAYVQFVQEASVEAALGLEGKKFPPLLPRVLRVMRARKGAVRGGRGERRGAGGGGAGRLGVGGRRGVGMTNGRGREREREREGGRGGVLFEGHRATAKDGLAGRGKKKHGKKPTTRSSRRGAAFKAAGGEKWKAKKS